MSRDDMYQDADKRTLEKYGAVLIQENERLRADRDYWRKEHARVLNESIQHGNVMLANLLMAITDPKLFHQKQEEQAKQVQAQVDEDIRNENP